MASRYKNFPIILESKSTLGTGHTVTLQRALALTLRECIQAKQVFVAIPGESDRYLGAVCDTSDKNSHQASLQQERDRLRKQEKIEKNIKERIALFRKIFEIDKILRACETCALCQENARNALAAVGIREIS